MRKYIILSLSSLIVLSLFFLFNTFNSFGDESIYTRIQPNLVRDSSKDEIKSTSQRDNYTILNEDMAVEKMFSYLSEQIQQPSKGFQIHLKTDEQEKDKYIMNVYRMIGEFEKHEELSRVKIGLYSLDKNTGKISPIS